MHPHTPKRSKLEKISSQALQAVWNGSIPPAPKEQAHHIEMVCDILLHNLSNGRWQHVTGGRDHLTDSCLRRYGLRVANRYWIERETISGLASDDANLWRDVYSKLERRALRACIRYGVPPERARVHAPDHAQEACEVILCSHYPCDVPFDAWAGRILINCILQNLQRSTDLMDREMFVEPTIEDLWDSRRSGQVPINAAQPIFKDLETHTLLLDAVERLRSEAQRQTILLEFFLNWDPDQIAKALGKSTQAVYNLKNRALENLREILELD